MRRKRHNRGDILIDLTSLLDVIFIILLIVICNQQNITNKTQAQQKEASELIEQAESQLQLYNDQMESVDYLCIVSVNARYEPDNVTARHISVQKKGEDVEVIDMIGNNTEEPLQKLQMMLEEYIDAHQGKPLILSLNENDEKILYRDEKAIQKIFNELKAGSEDVYIK